MSRAHSISGTRQRTPSATERVLKWTIFLGATAVILYFCALILAPFINVIAWSGVLAVAFHPVHQRLVRRTGRVSLSAFLCSILVVIVLVIPVAFITGLAVDQFLALREHLQHGAGDESRIDAEPFRRAYEWVAARAGLQPGALEAWLREHANELARITAEYSLALAANLTSLLASFIFTMFAMFLLFRDGDRLASLIPDLLPFEREQSQAMLLRIREVIYGGVYGIVVIAVIQGALCGTMFWVLGVPSAALWGLVTMLTGVLPLVGAAAVWVPGAAYLLLTGRWIQGLILIGWGIAVVSSVDNFLRPRLVGGRVGLSELAMFFALLGGLQVFGVLGIVLGPVLFAIAGSIFEVLSGMRVPGPGPRTRPGASR